MGHPEWIAPSGGDLAGEEHHTDGDRADVDGVLQQGVSPEGAGQQPHSDDADAEHKLGDGVGAANDRGAIWRGAQPLFEFAGRAVELAGFAVLVFGVLSDPLSPPS